MVLVTCNGTTVSQLSRPGLWRFIHTLYSTIYMVTHYCNLSFSIRIINRATCLQSSRDPSRETRPQLLYHHTYSTFFEGRDVSACVRHAWGERDTVDTIDRWAHRQERRTNESECRTRTCTHKHKRARAAAHTRAHTCTTAAALR